MKKGKRIPFEHFPTVFDWDVHFKGDMNGEDDVLIGGAVEGHLRCGKAFHLLSGAVIKDYIQAENCTLYGGEVIGELKIDHRLKVYSGSNIEGIINAEVLDVEGGACINATVSMNKKHLTDEDTK